MKDKNSQLEKAFDSGTLNGKLVHLNNEQATQFIDYIVDESAFMKRIRVVKMSKPTKTIAKLISDSRFLRPGTIGTALTSDKYDSFTSDTVELATKLVRGAIQITDEELQDNIEGQSFENHIMQIIAKKVSNDLEEMSIYGVLETNPVDIMGMFNGYKKLLLTDGNVVDAAVGYSDRYISKEKAVDMIKALKTKYRKEIEYFMPSDIILDYKLLFDTIADGAVRGDLTTNIMGKRYTEVPLMKVDEFYQEGTTTVTEPAAAGDDVITVASATGISTGKMIKIGARVYEVESVDTLDVTLTTPLLYAVLDNAAIARGVATGADVILGNPKNFIQGIQTADMELETERIPSVGWVIHYKTRVDVKIENEEAGVILTNLLVK